MLITAFLHHSQSNSTSSRRVLTYIAAADIAVSSLLYELYNSAIQ